ncbi:hypothetical protein [Nocardioides sp.]|uniref:hypothetical protein n=1 Tax=Nocardioides sp. TaxID=35761 RepID=UPI002B6F67A4|nr:hypothetical protein [Nocardioides sp.]HXH77202.1 hypothetical protein [Nocardioides sp.]
MTETLRPSRRSFVRAAAWTVPVVSIAAAAPAFALTTTSTFVTDTPVKWGSGAVKHVSWDLTLNNGAKVIDTVSITFDYIPNGSGSFNTFTIYGFSPVVDNGWVKGPVSPVSPYTVTATHAADIPANSVYRIHVDFDGADASAGSVSATATIKYVNIAGTVTVPFGTKAWVAGSQHVGH